MSLVPKVVHRRCSSVAPPGKLILCHLLCQLSPPLGATWSGLRCKRPCQVLKPRGPLPSRLLLQTSQNTTTQTKATEMAPASENEMDTARKNQQARHWLVTSPRTASNLLIKMLNLDEQGVRPSHQGGYFFKPSVFVRFPLLFHDGPIDSWAQEDRVAVAKVMQSCLETLQDHLEASEAAGNTIFVKEHAMFVSNPSIESHFLHPDHPPEWRSPVLEARGMASQTRSALNITALPDEFLHTWTPTFLIRHPALMLSSYYRTCLDHMKMAAAAAAAAPTAATGPPKRKKGEPTDLEMSMKWIRTLYDFYADYFSREGKAGPVVLDADDIMKHPTQLVPRYASLVGMDPAKVRLSWERPSEASVKCLLPNERRMLSTILASSGIDASKAAGDIDIEQEAVKWKEEFGEERARKLAAWVRAAMPDYEFLRARRMRAE
ncbi:uncharacterized protein B0I36DRAFT_413757 [Microdochium trichocladiopsis]|uniref:Uncharacterized protein n=1 Tax=Microdochium trichocladiopsis TaxID=1682393 RepID=A0A9P8Y2S3_9PEZI|nr:uncharacterized protein B0I36DRAFT_413757 [Microdochium trichocladiopsis]KAH7028157.1 hypothetical protein B0I36DRAFT_413757 [Microdochium trichocladiopsis]